MCYDLAAVYMFGHHITVIELARTTGLVCELCAAGYAMISSHLLLAFSIELLSC